MMDLRPPITSHLAVDYDNTSNNDLHKHHNEYDEEINETEEDLIENYRFLTQRCGVLRQSLTTGVLNGAQQKQTGQQTLLRHNSFINKTENNNDNNNNKNHNKTNELDPSLTSTKQWYSQYNDVNNNNHNYSANPRRIPETIYYEDLDDDESNNHQSFSLTKLFARIKTRLKHDKRYRPQPSHQILAEEDTQEWDELTKNVRTVLTKVLVAENLKDRATNRPRKVHSRKGSCKKARENHPVLANENDDEDKIRLEVNDDNIADNNEQSDETVWNKFISCSRGFNYRRCGICKAVDRQQFQGQLVYFYGVANNILIDENLKASGLG